MSYSVIIIADDGTETQADYSQQGWRNLRAMVATATTPQLHHLAEHGWNDDLPAIKAELESIKGTAPSDATNHSIDLLLQTIAESGQTDVPAIILSQGLANPSAPEQPDDAEPTAPEATPQPLRQ